MKCDGLFFPKRKPRSYLTTNQRDSGITRAPLYYFAWYTGWAQRHIKYNITCKTELRTYSEWAMLLFFFIERSFFIAHSTQFVHHVPLKQRTTRLININYKMPTLITNTISRIPMFLALNSLTQAHEFKILGFFLSIEIDCISGFSMTLVRQLKRIKIVCIF